MITCDSRAIHYQFRQAMWCWIDIDLFGNNAITLKISTTVVKLTWTKSWHTLSKSKTVLTLLGVYHATQVEFHSHIWILAVGEKYIVEGKLGLTAHVPNMTSQINTTELPWVGLRKSFDLIVTIPPPGGEDGSISASVFPLWYSFRTTKCTRLLIC